ncbi:MAG: hypothetical protein JNG88_17455 [Phycisphaerales bacterium]|nr:hypothetical protein [Phycisphaerales bacterium]
MNVRLMKRAGWLLVGLATGLPGCSLAGSLLDPGLLDSLGLGSRASSLPGDAPAVIIAFENRTNRPATATISYRVGTDRVLSTTVTALPGDKLAESFVCPVSEVTLGDVSNLNETGVTIRLGNGTAADPVIEVEPFGVLLRENQNYSCGDSIVFTVSPSGETRSGFRAFAFIQRAD